jgi:acyl dehydratase
LIAEQKNIAVGLEWQGNPIPMHEDEMMAFASRYDPQPMHMDVARAETGRFGAIIASGWHVLSLLMADNVRTSPFAGEVLGISADDVRWLKPVTANDILIASRWISEFRPSQSKAGMGIVRMNTCAKNQRGESVIQFSNLMLVELRAAA